MGVGNGGFAVWRSDFGLITTTSNPHLVSGIFGICFLVGDDIFVNVAVVDRVFVVAFSASDVSE